MKIDVDALAQEIRRVDGSHSLGAGALAEAITPYIESLSADRGEAVAYRWWRNGEPQGFWINGQPTQQQFAAAEQCKDRAEWTIEYAYAATPPSPAESAEGDMARALEAARACLAPEHVAAIAEAIAAYDPATAGARTARITAAAPSQVSDAMVERALDALIEHGVLKRDTAYEIDSAAVRAALEAAQPQPGRVEGWDRG